jgi:hypothetical protein
VKDLIDSLRKSAGGSTTWTKQGSDIGLDTKAHSALDEVLARRPDAGFVMFHRLEDGGYEIRSWEQQASTRPSE